LLKVSSFNKQITSFMLWKMYVMHLHHETKNDMIGVYYIEKECMVTSPFTERTLKSYPFSIFNRQEERDIGPFPLSKESGSNTVLIRLPHSRKNAVLLLLPYCILLFLFRSLFFLFAEYFYGEIIK